MRPSAHDNMYHVRNWLVLVINSLWLPHNPSLLRKDTRFLLRSCLFCTGYTEDFAFSKNLEFIDVRVSFLNNMYMFKVNLVCSRLKTQDSRSKQNDSSRNFSKAKRQQNSQTKQKQTNQT